MRELFPARANVICNNDRCPDRHQCGRYLAFPQGRQQTRYYKGPTDRLDCREFLILCQSQTYRDLAEVDQANRATWGGLAKSAVQPTEER